jgi:DNA-directed RNA polymerase specialized sigma54-like protein
MENNSILYKLTNKEVLIKYSAEELEQKVDRWLADNPMVEISPNINDEGGWYQNQQYERERNYEETILIKGIIIGGLMSIRYLTDGNLFAIKNTAEYIAIQLLPHGEEWHINTYNGVYRPIQYVLDECREEVEGGDKK